VTGRQPRADPPRVLLLSMYPLDGELRGPPVRVAHLRDALARRVALDVVSGSRLRRALALATYLARGRLRGLRGIYVETSTAIIGPADLAFLGLARARGIRVLSYVRDAYQLFPEYYPMASVKRRLAQALFPMSVWALSRVSHALAFPSRGLAQAVLRDRRRAERAPLLPPGARLADAPPLDPLARSLLYVGSLAHQPQGGRLLLDAMRLARERGVDVELMCVTPPEEATAPVPPAGWFRPLRAEGPEIDALLPGVLATVIPRRRSAYNDLALPIKLFEYLGYGRPLIVTDATETAAIVREAGCGVVVPDSIEGLADGIATVVAAGPDQLSAWGEAARSAATANSWDVRAARVLELLQVAA
jgi:glycosyltransferase involved in cell wall biosynthesis